MKTSSIYTIDHRSNMWMGWVGGYIARSRLGLGCADQLACLSCVYMMGSILDHLDVRVTTHLRVVSGISSAPDRALCSPTRLSVHVEWPVRPDLRRSDH